MIFSFLKKSLVEATFLGQNEYRSSILVPNQFQKRGYHGSDPTCTPCDLHPNYVLIFYPSLLLRIFYTFFLQSFWVTLFFSKFVNF